MSATYTHQGLPEGVKPFDLPDMLEKLRMRLGLRDEDIAYIRYLLRKVRAADFQPGRNARSGRRLRLRPPISGSTPGGSHGSPRGWNRAG